MRFIHTADIHLDSLEILASSMVKLFEFDALYKRAQALIAKHVAIRQSTAALLPATPERSFAASQPMPT